jgi:hypothetical protein
MFNNLYPEELASKIKPIKKLYYNCPPYSGFPYKIAFVCDGYGRVGSPRDRWFQDPDLTQEPDCQKFTDKLNAWLRKTYKQQYEWPSNLKDRDGAHRTLFLQDYENFNTILELFGDYVVSAERPVDQEHYVMLFDGDKLLFRPQYFWGKYEYKVGLKSSPDLLVDHLPWLEGFFKERDSLDYRFNSSIIRALRPDLNGINIYSNYNNYRRQKHYYYGHNIFLNNKEDVMMVKLKIGKDVHFVERVVKFKDLNKLATNIVDENTN